MLSKRSHFLQAFPIGFLPDGGPSQAALSQQGGWGRKNGRGTGKGREEKREWGKGKGRGNLEKKKEQFMCFQSGIMWLAETKETLLWMITKFLFKPHITTFVGLVEKRSFSERNSLIKTVPLSACLPSSYPHQAWVSPPWGTSGHSFKLSYFKG